MLVGTYARPLALTQDVGAGPLPISGLYLDEHNRALSYAYTDGDSTIRIQQAGEGRFVVRVRMGGPGTAIPVATHLRVDGRQIDRAGLGYGLGRGWIDAEVWWWVLLALDNHRR